MVVSVVTNDYSDDCNSTVVSQPFTYLRVSHTGPGWAFHTSKDGFNWASVRLFRLPTDADVHVGFLAQSPTGEKCTARFGDIAFSSEALRGLRDGS